MQQVRLFAARHCFRLEGIVFELGTILAVILAIGILWSVWRRRLRTRPWRISSSKRIEGNASMVDGDTVIVARRSILLADVAAPEKDLATKNQHGQWLVVNGIASADFDARDQGAEREARKSKRGLWYHPVNIEPRLWPKPRLQRQSSSGEFRSCFSKILPLKTMLVTTIAIR